MPYPNWIGRKRFWTRERVIQGLKIAAASIDGPLPCSDKIYNTMKKGRLTWPTATRIFFYFDSMPRGWLAAGADPDRVSLFNSPWLPEEDEYLLDNAGKLTLNTIAKKLHRSYPAVRARLNKFYHIKSRHNLGFFSAAEVAKEFQCPCHRVRDALNRGDIRGRFDRRRNRWEVDVRRLTEAEKAILTPPKRTHKNSPTDMGDYYRRHGLRRTNINGKMVIVPV